MTPNTSGKVRAVIVEDETLARDRLRCLIEEIDWIECIGEAADGNTAVEIIDRLRPDLVFLDIQLPRLNGLQVLERLSHHPAIIFTTAHDQYAVQAFELHALDYLLKPFGRDRLRAALERARGTRDYLGEDALERARRALGDAKPLTRLLVRQGNAIVPILVDNVERLEAEGDYVAIVAGGRRHLVYIPMLELEKRFHSDRFIRIHRSHIVNLDHVRRIMPYGDSRFQVEMRDGTILTASRAGSRAMRKISV